VADNPKAMIDDFPFNSTALLALVLGLLVFIMITCVLYTLAMMRFHAIRVHNLVRETRIMRNEYLAKHDRRSDTF
jgi:hypothetical protein